MKESAPYLPTHEEEYDFQNYPQVVVELDKESEGQRTDDYRLDSEVDVLDWHCFD